MKARLKEDIKSVFKERGKILYYGRHGEEVSIFERQDHGEMIKVENKWGKIFFVHESKIEKINTSPETS